MTKVQMQEKIDALTAENARFRKEREEMEKEREEMAKERADDAEKERDAARANLAEVSKDALIMLSDLGFDTMPLIPVGDRAAAPMFDSPLALHALKAQITQ